MGTYPYQTKTAEERAEEMKKMQEMLENGIESAKDSESYKALLSAAAKFHSYSVSNMILIYMQNPEATYVAGYKTWQKLGRHIRKGEVGLRIYAPTFKKVTYNVETVDEKTGDVTIEKKERTFQNFKAVSVFDVSQTDGKDIPGITGITLTGDVTDYTFLVEALKGCTSAKITFDEIRGLAKGYYVPGEHSICVKAGMPELQTVKTLAHEIAHSILHKDETGLARGQKELEAESVAFIFCKHFGLDTDSYSFGYISGWADENGTDKLRASLDRIQKTAGMLIEKTEAFMSGAEDAPEEERKTA